MEPLFTRSPSAGSKMVEMLKPFCCPGVGARNPLLTLARTKWKRPESLLFIVVPKSSKCSMRTAEPTVQSRSIPIQLDVAVERDVAAAPRPGGHRPVTEESVGSGRETLSPAVGADRPRCRIAHGGLVLLVPPFRPGRDVHHVGRGVGEVGVETAVALPVTAEIERGRRVGAE